jgi:hypothetical protein
LYLYLPSSQYGILRFTAIPAWQMRRLQLVVNGVPTAEYAVGDWASYTSPLLDLPAGLNVVDFVDLTGAERLWGDLRCVSGTTLAGPFPPGLECSPHQKGERQVSVALQAIDFVDSDDMPLAQFGSEFKLLSVEMDSRARAGDTIRVALHWRALQIPQIDYTTFVHILDVAGHLVAQHDGQPFENNFSTKLWTSGLFVSYDLRVSLPLDTPAGIYSVIMGLYDSSNGERLPVNESPDNTLFIGRITVVR